MRGDITTDATHTKRIINEYYEQFLANKFKSLYEIDIFLKDIK